MSLGGFLDSSSGGARVAPAADISPFSTMPYGPIGGHHSIFTSPGLSLALSGVDGAKGSEMHTRAVAAAAAAAAAAAGEFETQLGKAKEDEYESRSGSDNMDGAGSGDDQDADHPRKKKRYHRHTPQQIQELESLFKECPHPDEKQRLELSRRLSLESKQVKFWFQNRRTQMKTQLERHENAMLRQENDKLRAENGAVREAMRAPMCSNCGGPAVLGEVSLEEQHLSVENARLKDELDRVLALAGKFLGRPIPSMSGAVSHPPSSLDLAVGVGGGIGGGLGGFSFQPTPDFPVFPRPPAIIDNSLERSMFLELALSAMEELVKMAQTRDPLWFPPTVDGGRETLNYDEYLRVFPRCIGPKPVGFVTEATRNAGVVIINSLALVETLMDANRWVEMFPGVIARSSTTDVISDGMGGTRNGALQLMNAEFQVLSPLVPVREVNFLRFCKQLAEGVWAMVDVSIDTLRENPNGPTYISCRRLPSGCLVHDMPNGYSKVTWVEHAEYDDSGVHQLYRPLLAAGLAFGAHRLVAALQRQCECLAIIMSSSLPSRDSTAAITPAGRRSMLKLAQRMTDNFCAGVCASTVHQWTKIATPGDDIRVMTRKSVDDPGEPPGVVLSAATSVWLPIPPQRLFEFLRDERLRSEWDILSNGGPMQEMAHIAKGQDPGNSVSLLRAGAMNSNQNSMLILQETCLDAAGSLVVYAPVDIPAMHVVMNGGDSACVALLPSGFAIVPDGRQTDNSNSLPGSGGSLLTVAFQILVNHLPTAKLTMESVETVNNLIACTVQKIKAALDCES